MDAVPAVGPPLIGALLRMPADAVRDRIFADLHAAGFTDLVPAHFPVLRYPGPDDRRPSELAAEAGITRQALNYLLGDLERSGYLTRRDDPDDRRSRRVQLTERGETVALRIRATVGEIEAELEAQLGRARFAQLRELLVELNACAIDRRADVGSAPDA